MLARNAALRLGPLRQFQRPALAGKKALLSSNKALAFHRTIQTSAPTSPSSPPQNPRWRRYLTNFGRVTLVTILGSTAWFIYVTQQDRHPGEQLPYDPTKKTVVVLGSGWGATSLLKGMDTSEYNVVMVSPRNYFLFTPLLPSVAVGTLEPRSIMQSVRYIARHKQRRVAIYEAEATKVDPHKKTVTLADTSEIKGSVNQITIPYDILVYGVGAETQTFGIPGVKEHSCFLKEMPDAERLRERVMDCIESAAFPDQSEDEVNRLMHMVIVGGGPTGVEFAGEMHDFLRDDLRSWYPELADKLKITLIEALPNVLPMFSRELIQYTESTFKEMNIEVLTKTMVKEIKPEAVTVKNQKGENETIPFGLLVWAAGNVSRQVTRDLMAQLPKEQTNRRGLLVDDYLRLLGTDSIYALGDCTATSYAPTAQVASQQGAYLARLLSQLAKKEALENHLVALRANKDESGVGPVNPEEIESTVKQLNKVSKVRPFQYSHQGSLAYIGSDRAIADLPFMNGNVASGGVFTYLFWRSAYLSNLFSLRNRTLVVGDWIRTQVFGRDVAREWR